MRCLIIYYYYYSQIYIKKTQKLKQNNKIIDHNIKNIYPR